MNAPSWSAALHYAVLLLLAAGAAYWWLRTRGPGSSGPTDRRRGGAPIKGAGASADAHARELRTPLVRLATAAGISTRAETRARNFTEGAKGERYVAELLEPLTQEGWVFLADCALPRGEAQVDLVGISPRGLVVIVDPKKWDRRFRMSVRNNRLLHGNRDVSARMRGLNYETRTVASLLSVPVVPVAAMVGPMLRGTILHFRGIRLVPAEDVPELLRALDRKQLTTIPASRLADTARRLLPPKTTR
ncbi:nuclease-related domain-containing protein [Streptomyces sp. NPDC001068]|uniref:nuclease-related domain-containing protein n=1 Tax=Streptomyces sp. NPDC001068 TaxID=3364544 RepID=UPI0036C5F287